LTDGCACLKIVLLHYAYRSKQILITRVASEVGTAMSDVTQILNAIEQGDPKAAEQLLPLVYEELRKLAASKLAGKNPVKRSRQPRSCTTPTCGCLALPLCEEPTSTLPRLVMEGTPRGCTGTAGAISSPRPKRCAASLWGRRKGRIPHGGRQREHLLDADIAAPADDEQILLLDDALARLAVARPQAAELVRLRFFAGLTLEEIAPLLALSERTARRLWVFARAWLRREMERSADSAS
jgi:hypothetical protein